MSLQTNTSLIIGDINVLFNNNEPNTPTGNGHFGPLLADNTFRYKTVNVYLKFKADATDK